ncbi:peptidoglycan DD-metalloendopeptidase family protein [Agromyces sp. Marseille-Q5079]|uniref:M23 family metallopeptidase n=1 Tax=Agromyces sp. Marseille-Q5079 TaxID=3439059 RepID=UPI003D9C85DF
MTFPHHGRRSAARTRAPFRASTAPRPVHSFSSRTASAFAAVPPLGSLIPARAGLAALTIAAAFGLALSTSTPAIAVSASDTTVSVYAPVQSTFEDTVELEPQVVEVASEAVMAPVPDGGYAVEAAPPPITSQVASVGTVSLIETDRIVWPVITPERTSDGFGPRSAPCAGCSTNHDGIDFNPGAGTPVMSVADGVVVLATENGGGLGVNVEVQHNIGGELVTSSYAHMQNGSIAVSVGQQVTAGQQLGLVGSTGQATGPHLHLEMFGTDGVRFDGFAWLAMRVTG